MRIVVNDLAASQTGALAVVKSFYNYICENDHDNEWIFLLSGEYLESRENIRIVLIPEVKKSWFSKLMFDFVTGRKEINELHPDYVLSMQNIITFGVKQRQGVYIHQSIPFQSTKRFSFLKRNEFIYAVYQYLIGSIIKLSARKADDVFVQTKWMKRAVGEKARVEANKITVVPTKAEKFERTGIESEKNRFFYPAGFVAVYKNHECIYDAVKILEKRGYNDYSVILTLEGESTEHIKRIGYLNREQMGEEYCKSVLLFPSYIETVGLPLVEAMSVGAVILAADCEYAHEVLDEYENVYFFDPFKPEESAELMRKSIVGELKTLKVQKTDMVLDIENPWLILTGRIKEL